MTVLWGRRNRERRRRRNGESRDNRRSFDFAQDGTFLVMGMGMRYRWLTADSSAALRNDKQKSLGNDKQKSLRNDKQKSLGNDKQKSLRNDKQKYGQRQWQQRKIRRWLRLGLRCVPVLLRRPIDRDRCCGTTRRGVRLSLGVVPGAAWE